jgi:hypothetical protein
MSKIPPQLFELVLEGVKSGLFFAKHMKTSWFGNERRIIAGWGAFGKGGRWLFCIHRF